MANKIKGTKGNDIIHGTNGNDVIRGKAGDDTIDAGKGYNKIFGGKGADTFVFQFDDLGNALNKVKDFKPGVDTIELAGYGEYFDTLPDLSSFDVNDYGTYHKGKMFADLDGDGGYNPIQIAKLVGNLGLSEGDFYLS